MYIPVFRRLHILSRDPRSAENRIITESANNYISDVIEESLKRENMRNYTKQADCSIINHITNIINDERSENIDRICSLIAERLLDKEINASRTISNFTELQKGSLIQSMIKNEDNDTLKVYLIAKVEHTEFIEEHDLVELKGLPKKHRVYKICIIYFENDTAIEICIYDGTKHVANYWWNDFLEMEPIVNDEKNTSDIFQVPSIINKHTVYAPDDRKNLLGRFYSYTTRNSVYRRSDFITELFQNYTPVHNGLKLDIIKSKIKSLCDDCDGQFNLDRAIVMNFTLEKDVRINPNVKLTIMGHPDGQTDIIESYEMDGRKFLRLKLDNDEVYKRFKRVE